MTEVLKVENIKVENFYRFTLKYKWKIYKNLSIEVNNYKKDLKILWVNFDNNLLKNEDFRDIEKKLFWTLRKKLKKQIRENNLSLTIKNNWKKAKKY